MTKNRSMRQLYVGKYIKCEICGMTLQVETGNQKLRMKLHMRLSHQQPFLKNNTSHTNNLLYPCGKTVELNHETNFELKTK